MEQATRSNLIALCRLDGALGEIARQINVGPERIAHFRARQAEARTRLEERETALAEIGRRRRELESATEALEERVAQFQKQLLAIKSNDDYQAMLRQIGETRQKLGEQENAVLELLEREEELGARVAAERDAVADEVAGAGEEIARIEQEIADLERQRATRATERQHVVEQLDAETRRMYERIQHGKPGSAVVAVDKGACGGCHNALPPQRLNETRLGTRLITCEACGRIVIWDEETSST